MCKALWNGVQTVTPKRGAKIIHVETELGIVNVRLGLSDPEGRDVEAVEMIADDYSGEPTVSIVGRRFVREETQ